MDRTAGHSYSPSSDSMGLDTGEEPGPRWVAGSLCGLASLSELHWLYHHEHERATTWVNHPNWPLCHDRCV